LGSATYGANGVRELGDPIVLADGETRADLKLRIFRSGVISGRVVDPDGEPALGVQVNLVRAGRIMRGASTNDKGEYKITQVDVGEYYLRCYPNRPQIGGMTPKQIVVPQFYGGSRDAKDAVRLTLRGGEVLAGFDFHLNAEQPAKITGRVTGVPPADPPSDGPEKTTGIVGPRFVRRGGGGLAIQIEMSTAGDEQNFVNNTVGAQPPDYRFELPEVAPGQYRLQATFRGKDGKTYFAVQTVNAQEGFNDVILSMVPGVTLKGHLKVEGPATGGQNINISLAAPSGPQRNIYSGRVGKDGNFSIDQVPPGEWVLNVNSNLAEKSVTLGDKDFLFKNLEIPAGSEAQLQIVLANPGSIEGEVDKGGADVKRAGILLEPLGPRHSMLRYYYGTEADESGKFKLQGVAPGKYRIFALEKINPQSFRNPESTDLLDAKGEQLGEDLEVAEGVKTTSHPKLIGEEKVREILRP
jgi:hypothetical protein